MPSIVDAIKEKHPEATGSTIAEVIRTSESGGSDNDYFFIELSYDSDSIKVEGDIPDYVVDKTVEEIEEAYQNGKILIVRQIEGACETLYRFSQRDFSIGGYTFMFNAEPQQESPIISNSSTTVTLLFSTVIIRSDRVEVYDRYSEPLTLA